MRKLRKVSVQESLPELKKACSEIHYVASYNILRRTLQTMD